MVFAQTQWTDRWMDRPTDQWTDRWMDGRMDRRMDGWTDGWMDGWTDRPSYRDVFLTDASKKANRHNGCFDGWMHKQTIPLIKMGGRKRNSNRSNIYSLEPNWIVAQTATLPSK